MTRPVTRLPLGERRIAAEVLLGSAAVLAVVARVQGFTGIALAGLSLLLAASLLLVVEAPVGSVPLGYALLIALAELLDAGEFFPVVGIALLATIPVLVRRYGQADAARRVARWAVAAAACGGAAAAMAVIVPHDSPSRTLLRVSVAGAVFLAAEFMTRRMWSTPTAPPMRLREAWPVYLSLLCAAGLIAVGYRQRGIWMALVALFPLLLTRFAFERYAAAQQAYRQTIKALSIVPEVAGVTPLGHGERSAVYAVALARRLGLSTEAVDRIATAARLHHIGYVTLDDPQEAVTTDKQVLSELGGNILRETRFLADVGDLVESVHSEDPRFKSREASVLRIAATFDNYVLEDPSRVERAVDVLASHESDAYDAAAVLALKWVLEEDPDVVQRAIASGTPLTEAAAASEAAQATKAAAHG